MKSRFRRRRQTRSMSDIVSYTKRRCLAWRLLIVLQQSHSLDLPDITLPERLRSSEIEVCRTVVANVFGYHALQISSLGVDVDMLATAQTISCHQLSVTGKGHLSGCIAGHLNALPLQDESVALMVLDHVHEQAPGRRELWGELHRVLRPGGVAVIVGLSPRGYRHPALMHPLSALAMAEQLRGFDLSTLLVRPVSERGGRVRGWLARTFKRWSGAPWLGYFGQSFVLVAKKNSVDPNVVTLRPRRLSALTSGARQLGNAQGRGVSSRALPNAGKP
ncbi:MAG: class I SAM-dependent methyltransferase [Lysobacterales bacterium]